MVLIKKIVLVQVMNFFLKKYELSRWFVIRANDFSGRSNLITFEVTSQFMISFISFLFANFFCAFILHSEPYLNDVKK